VTIGISDIDIRELHKQPVIELENDQVRRGLDGGGEVALVPLDLLSPGDSPRLEGHNAEHVARLAESDTPLPPILVERRRMRVIDGMHRLMAAIVSGRETIEVEFFDGSEAEAFLRGVQANISHGLPLTLPDRRAAASRIIHSHPHMSNRAIAEATGLGRTTVATLRQRIEFAGPVTDSGLRLGIDGRLRPVNSAEGRYRAAQYLEENPQASLREVARNAGVALGTASDVRRRMLEGLPALPAGVGMLGPDRAPEGPEVESPGGQCAQDAPDEVGDVVEAVCAARPALPGADPVGRVTELTRPWLRRRRGDGADVDPEALLTKLLRDPSLRYSDAGRQLLTTLRSNAVISQDRHELVASLPPHCEVLVRQLAEHYARMWQELARELAVPDRATPRFGPACA
jgi:hypothetical protein